MSSFASQFNNFLVNTREARLTGPREIVNDLARLNYLWFDMARGTGGRVNIQSGREISDTIKLQPFSNSTMFVPGSSRSPSRGPTDVRIYVPWRMSETSRTWTEAEIDLNNGDAFTTFKDFETSLFMDLNTDHAGFLDDKLWTVPNQSLMEVRTQGENYLPYSIPTLITENGIRAPGWTTTVEFVDPSTAINANWRNAVETYDAGAPENSRNGLFAAFDKMFLDIDYRPPAGLQRYFTNDNMKMLKIVTNKAGHVLMQRLIRDANNITRAGPQDPGYPDPQYQGVPIMYCAALDSALLEESGAVVGGAEGTYANTAYDNDRPRFFFINTKYLKIVGHQKHFLRETDPKEGSLDQRDTFAVWKETWWNLVCTSRRRQGLVRPA